MVNKISAEVVLVFFFCGHYNTIPECRSLRKIKASVIESHLKENKSILSAENYHFPSLKLADLQKQPLCNAHTEGRFWPYE